METQFAWLEAERELIDEVIAGIKRRFEGIDEGDSWSLLAQEETRLENVANPTLGINA